MLDDIAISASILAADMARLADELAAISEVDYIHVDVMDGHFVPNLAFGPSIVRCVHAVVPVPTDVHLMVSNPDEVVGAYLEAGADIVTFHVEAATHAHRIITNIHDAGARAGVALNPGTPVGTLESLIDELDLVLVMSVDPGFGCQPFISHSLHKLRQVHALARAHNVRPLVEVDGGVDATNATEIVEAGAGVLVAGSAIFGQPDRAAAVQELRELGRAGLTRRT